MCGQTIDVLRISDVTKGGGGRGNFDDPHGFLASVSYPGLNL